MKNISISTKGGLQRRHFLKGVGVTLALPILEAMVPVGAAAKAASAIRSVKRMVVFSNAFGMYPVFSPYGFSYSAGSIQVRSLQ